MGKRFDPTERERGDTRILYKKSISTIQTHSRTNSFISQTHTKTGLLHLKKKLSHSMANNKDKKDLSIETDLCVLRRYYRNKRNKLSRHEVEETEIAEIKEEQKFEAGDTVSKQKIIDVVGLIADNFKTLINKWIKEQILINNDNTQKIDTVRDSILHRLNSKDTKDSQSTFVYNASSKTKIHKQNRNSKCSKRRDRPKALIKCSRYTIPFHGKSFKIVSTLSIPRNFEKSSLKGKNRGTCLYRLKKISRKNIFLSVDKPKKMFVDSSIYNLLAMSSRSLTKRCVTYIDKSRKEEVHRKVIFQPNPAYKSPTESSCSLGDISIDSVSHPRQPELAFDNLPSLIKSIYDDIPTRNNRSFVYVKNDNGTMTDSTAPDVQNICNQDQERKDTESRYKDNILYEQDPSDPMVTIDFISHSLEFPCLKNNSTTTKKVPHKRSQPKCNLSQKKAHTRLKKMKSSKSAYSNIYNTKNKHFTYLYKKINRRKLDHHEFLGHFENILEHFAEYKGRKNIRIDIHVNVVPIDDSAAPVNNEKCLNQTTTVVAVESNTRNLDTLIEFKEKESSTLKNNTTFNNDDAPEIISLLDGAASQAKYIVMSENEDPVENTKAKVIANVLDSTTITSDLEISNEIVELKNVIKDLATTAEKLMYEHLKDKYKSNQKSPKTTILFNPTSPVITSTEGSQTKKMTINKNKSKGIQISNNFIKNNTGFKVQKEPKRPDTAELYNRLMKKSTTYRFIESESILKVTDMTSKGNDDLEKKGPKEVGLTCSLPKSESVFEGLDKEKRKLMAFYCDGMYQQPIKIPANSSVAKSVDTPYYTASKPSCRSMINVCTQAHKSCASPTYHQITQEPKTMTQNCPEKGLTDWSVEPKCKTERRHINTSLKRQSSLFKSFLYSVLVLIPVIVVVLMYYFLIIKNTQISREFGVLKTGTRVTKSPFYLKLSDFGF